MRRFSNDQQQNLLALTGPQRLFVQRWVELFDRESILGVRCRPFWPAKLRAELRELGRNDVHRKSILPSELNDTNEPTSLNKVDLSALDSDPVAFTESLAFTCTSQGFHHNFLFQAYKVLLNQQKTFADRIDSLINWWIQNARDRTMCVVFCSAKPGSKHAAEALGLNLKRWGELPESVRSCAQGTLAWWHQHQGIASENSSFLCMDVSARDPDAAAGTALERYRLYCSLLAAVSPGKHPISIDNQWALVDDTDEKPIAKAYMIPIVRDRFHLRGSDKGQLIDEISELARSNEHIARLIVSYGQAVRHAKDGNVIEAMQDLSTGGLDLVYCDCPSLEVKPQRLFFERTSTLVALDWPRTLYAYYLEYALSPSYAVDGRRLFGNEVRPEKIYDIIANNDQWQTIIEKSNWDELLKYRTRQILDMSSGLKQALVCKKAQLLWDLARAVRSRNKMFHRGQPLEDEYLLSVLLDAFKTIIHLRLAALRVGKSFKEVVNEAECDFRWLTQGTTVPNYQSLVSFGWRRWTSTVDNDL